MKKTIEEKQKIKLAEKFDYIMSSKKIPNNNKTIGLTLGYADGRIVGLWRKFNNKHEIQNSILLMAQEALEKHFDIPLTLWEDSLDYDKMQIDQHIQAYREAKEKAKTELKPTNHEFPFYENNDLLQKLEGVWYAYSYNTTKTNGITDIYTIKTTINSDATVIDENNNKGRVFLGYNQSMIIKESKNSRDLVNIVFNNTEIAYGRFHLTLSSKRNVIRRSICNFGFFSKEKLTKEEYMKILGDKIHEMQLQMSVKFEERVLG